MKKTTIFLLTILLLWVTYACKKETVTPETPDETDTTTLLTATWRITGLTENGSPVDVTDQDAFTLSANGNYTATIPELSFFPTSGKWALSNDSKQLILNGGDQVLSIITLNETDLVLEYMYENLKEQDVKYKITMKKS